MRKFRKYVVALLLVVMSAFVITGCEKTSSQVETEAKQDIWEQNVADVAEYTESAFAATMLQATYEDAVAYVESGSTLVSRTFDNDWLYRWGQFNESCGAVTSAKVDETVRTSHGYTSRIILTGDEAHNNAEMAMTITYDEGMRPVSTTIADYIDESQTTMGQKMSQAGSNTIVGVLTVFCILAGLSIVISLFKYVNIIGSSEEKNPKQKVVPAKKPAPAAPAAPAAPVKAAPAVQTENLVNDEVLVAVIAAAIAAAEDKPVEGFQVRSIKRLRNNKWR